MFKSPPPYVPQIIRTYNPCETYTLTWWICTDGCLWPVEFLLIPVLPSFNSLEEYLQQVLHERGEQKKETFDRSLKDY